MTEAAEFGRITEWAAFDFDCIEEARDKFDTEAYSRMKHGDYGAAQSLAQVLVQRLTPHRWWQELDEERGILVMGAPTTSVPVAASFLAEFVFAELFISGVVQDTDRVERGHIQRSVLYVDDYATMTAEKRKEVLEGDSLSLDTRLVRRRDLVLVDDVTVTGGHARNLDHFLDSTTFGKEGRRIHVTLARYTGDRPEIEHELNTESVKNGRDVMLLAINPRVLFKWNTRGTREALKIWPGDESGEEFKKKLLALAVARGRLGPVEFYTAARVKKYGRVPELQRNFLLLEQFILNGD